MSAFLVTDQLCFLLNLIRIQKSEKTLITIPGVHSIITEGRQLH